MKILQNVMEESDTDEKIAGISTLITIHYKRTLSHL